MRFRTVLIGIFIIIAAFVVGGVTASNALMNLQNFGTQSFIIAPARTVYLQLNVTNSSLVIVTYRASAGVDFYFANETGFGLMRPYLNSSANLTGEASKLYGSGILLAYINSSSGTFPYNALEPSASAPAFHVNNTLTVMAGNYYAMIVNARNSTVNISMVSDVTPNPERSVASLSVAGIGVLAIFVFGIAVLIYGIMQKPPKKEPLKSAVTQEQIDKLYANVDKGKKAHRKKTRKNNARRSRSRK